MTQSIITADVLKPVAEGLRIVHDGPVALKPGQRLNVRLAPTAGPLSVPDVRDIELNSDDANALKFGVTKVTGKFPLAVQVPVRVEVEWSVRGAPSGVPGYPVAGGGFKPGEDFEVLPQPTTPDAPS